MATIALLTLPLGYYRAYAAQAGWLTVDLGKWAGVKVTLGDRTVEVTARDIMDALTADCRVTGDCKRG